MDKKTKQLVILVVLIVVAGGFAVWRLNLFGGDKPANTAETNPGGTTPVNPAGGPVNPTGQPAGTPGQPTPGTTPAGGPAPQTQNQDLEIPNEVKLTPPRYDWPVKRGGATDIPDPRFPIFDPLRVQNIDVVDPDRKKYIEELKEQWILDGITVTVQKRLKIDATGKPMIGESVMEPKPVYQLVPQLDENGKPAFGPDGEVVMIKQIVYEKDEDGKTVMMDELDDEGNPKRNSLGQTIRVPKPKYEQAVDEDGNLKYDDEGNPVWVMQPKYRDGRRVVKKVPLIIRRQKMVDGVPQFDPETGKPILIDEQIYEQATDRDGKPKFDESGNPVWAMVPVLDKQGKPVLENGEPKMVPKKKMIEDSTPQTEVVPVIEAWFKDRPRPFRELDRLTNTRFTIEKIFTDRVYQQEGSGEVRVRSGVDLLGDTGARITLFLADDSRYEKDGG